MMRTNLNEKFTDSRRYRDSLWTDIENESLVGISEIFDSVIVQNGRGIIIKLPTANGINPPSYRIKLFSLTLETHIIHFYTIFAFHLNTRIRIIGVTWQGTRFYSHSFSQSVSEMDANAIAVATLPRHNQHQRQRRRRITGCLI